MESFRRLHRHTVYRTDPDRNLQYFRLLPDTAPCAGSGSNCYYKLYQQPNRTGTAVKPDPSGFRLYHGYGSDHPDRNSYPSADRNLYRYRSHSVRYHGSIKLRYRPSDSSGWFRSFHRFRHCKAANGEGCKSYPSILPVHDHYAASDHICTGNQPVAASGIGITAKIIYN